MTDTKQIDLLDSDGENLAVRAFLMLYGCTTSPSIEGMRDHMKLSGFDGCWPDWAATQFGFLSKGGAQNWIRHLFSLEADRNKRLTDYDRNVLASCANWLDARSHTVWAEQFGHQHLMREYAKDIRALLSSVAPRVPEGFVLVPKEPTREMKLAADELFRIERNAFERDFVHGDTFMGPSGEAYYATMLAAAPQPTQEG